MATYATYTKSSPWHKTVSNDLYLETLTYRPIVKNPGDKVYIIENQYKHRPDLLANDLYGDPKLWWVFVHRNRDVLKDPVFDFIPGTTIFLPNKKDLEVALRK
jgi:hypothetical protein